MPDYTITDPNTGETHKLHSDKPLTTEELTQAVNGFFPAKKTPPPKVNMDRTYFSPPPTAPTPTPPPKPKLTPEQQKARSRQLMDAAMYNARTGVTQAESEGVYPTGPTTSGAQDLLDKFVTAGHALFPGISMHGEGWQRKREITGDVARSPVGAFFSGVHQGIPGTTGGLVGGAVAGTKLGARLGWPGAIALGLGGAAIGSGLDTYIEKHTMDPEDYKALQEARLTAQTNYPYQYTAGELLPNVAAFGSNPITGIKNVGRVGTVARTVVNAVTPRAAVNAVKALPPGVVSGAGSAALGGIPAVTYVASQIAHKQPVNWGIASMLAGGGVVTQGRGVGGLISTGARLPGTVPSRDTYAPTPPPEPGQPPPGPPTPPTPPQGPPPLPPGALPEMIPTPPQQPVIPGGLPRGYPSTGPAWSPSIYERPPDTGTAPVIPPGLDALAAGRPFIPPSEPLAPTAPAAPTAPMPPVAPAAPKAPVKIAMIRPGIGGKGKGQPNPTVPAAMPPVGSEFDPPAGTAGPRVRVTKHAGNNVHFVPLGADGNPAGAPRKMNRNLFHPAYVVPNMAPPPVTPPVSPIGETPPVPNNTKPMPGEARIGPNGELVTVKKVDRSGNVIFDIEGGKKGNNIPLLTFNQSYPPAGGNQGATQQVVQQGVSGAEHQGGKGSGPSTETGSGDSTVGTKEGVPGQAPVQPAAQAEGQVAPSAAGAIQAEIDRISAIPVKKRTADDKSRLAKAKQVLGALQGVEPRPGEPDTGVQSAAMPGGVTLNELFPKITDYIRGRGTHYSFGKDAIIRAIDEDEHMDAPTKERVTDFLKHFPEQYWESMGFRFRTMLSNPKNPNVTPWGMYHMGRATVEVSRWGHQVERFAEAKGVEPEGYAADTFTHEFTHHLQRFLDENDYAALIKQYEQPGVEDAWKKTLDLNAYPNRGDQFDEWVQHQIQQLALNDIATKNMMTKGTPFQRAIGTMKVMAKTAADFFKKRGQPTASQLVYKQLVEGKAVPRLTLHIRGVPGAHPRGATEYRDLRFSNFPPMHERAAMHGLAEAPDVLERSPQTGLPPLVRGEPAVTNPFFNEVFPDQYASIWGENAPPPLLPGMVTQDPNLMNRLVQQHPGLVRPAPPQPPGQTPPQPKAGDLGTQYSAPGPTPPTPPDRGPSLPERVKSALATRKAAGQIAKMGKQEPFGLAPGAEGPEVDPNIVNANRPRLTPLNRAIGLPQSVVSPTGQTLQRGDLEAKLGPDGKQASQIMVGASREMDRMMHESRQRLGKVKALLDYQAETAHGATAATEAGQKVGKFFTGKPTTREQMYSLFREFIEKPLDEQDKLIKSGSVPPAYAEAVGEYHKYTDWMKRYLYDYKKNVLKQENMPDFKDWGITDRGYFYHTMYHDFAATMKDSSGAPMQVGGNTYPELTAQIDQALKAGGTLVDVRARENRLIDPTLRVNEGRFWRIVNDVVKSGGKDVFGRNVLDKNDVLADLRGEIGMEKNKLPFLAMTLKRAGKEGYESDAFFHVMNRYAATAINGVEVAKMRRQLQPLAEKLGKDNPSAQSFIENRMNLMAGQPSENELHMADQVHEMLRGAGLPGMNPNPLRSMRNLARNVQNAVAYATLTSRPSSALVNLTQPAVTLLPRIGLKAFNQAVTDSFSKGNRDMMREIGILSHDMSVANVGGKLQAVMVAKSPARFLVPGKGSVDMFRAASEQNRAVGFMAGYNSAKTAGLTHDQAVQEGLNYALMTEFTSNKAYAPGMLQTLHGGVQFQYQGYTINNIKQWTETMRDLGKFQESGITQKEAYARFGRKLGAQILLGGVKSLAPFLISSGTYFYLKDNGVPEPIARTVTNGLPANLGIDFSGPTGVMPDYVANNWQEAVGSAVIGPGGTTVMRVGQALTSPESRKGPSTAEKVLRTTGLGRQYLAGVSLVTGKPLFFGTGTPGKEGVIRTPLDKAIVLFGGIPWEMTISRGEAAEKRTMKNPGPSLPDVNRRRPQPVMPTAPAAP